MSLMNGRPYAIVDCVDEIVDCRDSGIEKKWGCKTLRTLGQLRLRVTKVQAM
jgi:hypothetical protein